MYKDILVHLDGGARDMARLTAALDLTRRFGGRLTALFARQEYYSPAIVARRASEAFENDAAKSEAQFVLATQMAGLPTRWWRLAHGEPAHVVGETVACARFADLVILGQHHDGKHSPDSLIEQVILESGRPVLIWPAVGDFPTLGSNILVGWNASRECSRALHDSLPLLRQAESVEILSVRAPLQTPRETTEALPPLSILDHLRAAHHLNVRREVLAGEQIGVMDLLLSRAFDQGADLLVMGAAGKMSRRTSGTRHVLQHMTLPVLLAH